METRELIEKLYKYVNSSIQYSELPGEIIKEVIKKLEENEELIEKLYQNVRRRDED